jgi:hypothetical protein
MVSMTIDQTGTLRFIYHDDLQPLLTLGKPAVRRVSHVEPTEDGRWTADLSPVDGPVLGPFTLRKEALTAEMRWLEENTP